ncbi:tetratricopeptide repeat protein [Saccharothrix sp. HUAS TT1]|uniref:tetratricopeptide repeat protein n=1 Tax=unclassified Saccharothrix TaxID=2593673 RepID=UPI00345B8D6A
MAVTAATLIAASDPCPQCCGQARTAVRHAWRVEQRGVASDRSAIHQAARDLYVNTSPAASPGLATLVVPEEVAHPVRGRDDLLTELSSALELGGQVVVLHGNGGHGKTTVAVQVARRAAVETWWVDASSSTNVTEGLREVALRAGADEQAVQNAWSGAGSAPEALWRALDARATPWLLVLDNADDPRVLAPDGVRVATGRGWLRTPRSTGTVLITSRDGRRDEWGDRTFVPVDVLGAADAARVLLDLAPGAGGETDARDLAERLGGLPLGLRLAGQYLGATSQAVRLPGLVQPRTFAEYGRALANGAELRGHEVLAGTWELSLDLLARRGQPLARPLLRLLSSFAPAPIPTELLDATVLATSETFVGITPFQLADLVEGLRALGLVDHRANALVLHPLVRDANLRPGPGYDDVRVAVLDRLVKRLDSNDPATWALWHALLPHCVQLPDEAIDVHVTTATFCLRVDLHHEAERLYRRVLSVVTARSGEDDREALLLRHTLATLADWRGDRATAEAELRSVLDAQRRALGPDHPDTVSTGNELARVTGRHDAARVAELRELLAAQTDTLGPGDRQTVATRDDLARELVAQNRLTEALVEYRELFATRSATLGADHPDVMRLRQNIATLLQIEGDFDGADAEYRALLPVRSRVLGPEHSETLGTRTSAAMNSARRGHLESAEAELRDVVSTCERALGAEHPQTLLSRQGLDRVLEARASRAP